MSMNANLHVYGNRVHTLKTESRIQELSGVPDRQSAYLQMSYGGDILTIYLDNVEDIERIAFEATTLAMAAREAWQTSQESTKEENA